MAPRRILTLWSKVRQALPAATDRLRRRRRGRALIALAVGAAVAFSAVAIAGATDSAGKPSAPTSATAGWPSPNYDLSNTRADSDTAIDAANVATLKPKWTFKLPDLGEYGSYTTNALVVDGVVYFESPKSNVIALNANTGALLWEHKYNSVVPSGGPTGLAIGDGLIFGATASSAFALELASGKQVWIHSLIQNDREGIDSAPQFYDGKVLISTIPGSAYNYYQGDSWGIVYQLNAKTGATEWSFSTVQGSSALWGDPSVNGGGGLWYPPAVDALGRVFFGTGNPSPVYSTSSDPNAKTRPGPDLYTDSIVAVAASSGKLLWYYQVTPHDVRDHDFQDSPIIATQKIGGKRTEIVIGSGKSGKVAAFRASNGKLLWLLNIGMHNAAEYGPLPAKPVLVCPGPLGGVLTPMAYSAGVVYVPWIDLCLDQSVTATPSAPKNISETGGLAAVDAATGAVIWSHHFDSVVDGAATVANNVVFTAAITGMVYALSTKTGAVLWSSQASEGINGSPAVTGNMLIVGAGLSNPKTAHGLPELIAYALGGK
jgi:alcohol dehydrogenase (cytochrome c)